MIWCLGGTEARKRKSEGKRNFNNTLKLSVSEQAHRKEALAEVSWPTYGRSDWCTQVYYMFDLDGDGSVSEEEMMRVGQARKELGGRCIYITNTAHQQHTDCRYALVAQP